MINWFWEGPKGLERNTPDNICNIGFGNRQDLDLIMTPRNLDKSESLSETQFPLVT